MPTKKQIRRQQKLKRHEWEEVYVDEEGRELDPEEAAELIGATQSPKAAKTERAARKQPAARAGRTIEPPSMRRTLKRGMLFAPLMLVTVHILDPGVPWGTKIVSTAPLLLFFLPFSYFLDTMVYRSYQKRMGRDEPKGS